MDFTWLSEVEELTSAALTVRAQTISPNDNGRLLWDTVMPRNNVDSMELEDISTVDWRPAADRRDWNMRGRYIPMITPTGRRLAFIPIEAYDKVEEEEIQKLFNRTAGNAQVMRDIIQVSIPQRVNRLAESDYRRLELDVFEAWALGQITQVNPQNGLARTISYNFDAGRYQVAGTPWGDVSVNAYQEFLAWVREGVVEVGSLLGVLSRESSISVIQADAPTATGITLSIAQLNDQISQDLGRAFRFIPNENTVDRFPTAGVTRQRVKVWAANTLALVPADGTVGYSAFAPVIRASELATQAGNAGIDVRGVTVYYDSANLGRELTIEGQLNAFPVPNEQDMWVMDAGA